MIWTHFDSTRRQHTTLTMSITIADTDNADMILTGFESCYMTLRQCHAQSKHKTPFGAAAVSLSVGFSWLATLFSMFPSGKNTQFLQCVFAFHNFPWVFLGKTTICWTNRIEYSAILSGAAWRMPAKQPSLLSGCRLQPMPRKDRCYTENCVDGWDWGARVGPGKNR